MSDIYVYFLVPLLPLTALMTVSQTNPYQTIVLRGILGAMAALIYTIFGAPDVALTEALVGTLLAVTLYAIAIRSSLVLRLGVLSTGEKDEDLGRLVADLRSAAGEHHLRLELVTYDDEVALMQAYEDEEIHARCVRTPASGVYQTSFRVLDFYNLVRENTPAVIYTGNHKS
ncbi:MAG: hypothetical protein N5P05_000805 [Chroococcopsis gigantea SAG 12.99]|jgi:putative multicomponent Na+:H+ antiporter subunit B|nr:DUF4040 domain-containing protein [Chlorogloea purpurea SAG 13.99]MDV2999199.1 hypothetical protein [Chroococcopsis gigantea SAG 12.99]